MEEVFVAAPPDTTRAFYAEFAALRLLRDELNNLRSLAEGLPRLEGQKRDRSESR